jgi:hypothetical protein
MHQGRQKAETELEQEVTRLLSRWDQATIERIDSLLTDCAAAALRLSVARLRIDRDLDEMSRPRTRSARWGSPARMRDLFAERRRLAVTRDRIEEMTRSLRRHRNRLTPLRGSRI